MMLHHPGMIVAKPVSGFQLLEGILIKLELIAGFPRARQLQLIKDAEFHDVSPATGLLFCGSVFARRAKSSLGQFRRAEGWLALGARMVSFVGRLSRRLSARPVPTETPCPLSRRIRIPR